MKAFLFPLKARRQLYTLWYISFLAENGGSPAAHRPYSSFHTNFRGANVLAYSILDTYLVYCPFHNKTSRQCIANTVICVTKIVKEGMVTTQYSVPTDSGIAFPIQEYPLSMAHKMHECCVVHGYGNHQDSLGSNTKNQSFTMGQGLRLSANSYPIDVPSDRIHLNSNCFRSRASRP